MSASVTSGASGPLAAGTSVWEVFDAWLRRASAVIAASADALDALNVFPVSDADTGTNLRLTLSGIARAVPDVNRASLGAVVQAAILSAHGNSGAIVAEMFSSVCRSLEHDHPQAAAAPAGTRVALLLQTVAAAARRAVARPVAGTILTVADDTAQAALAAATDHPDDPLAVAEAARTEARAALQRTPQQLDVLAAGGVVDAGGQAYALLVDALVEVLGGEPAQPLALPATAPRPVPAAPEQDYEVMYAVHGADADALDGLRARLSDLGHSVVVAGGQDAVAQVHVHLAEPGAAVEAALGLGRLSQIRITALEVRAGARLVVALVAGPGLAAAVREGGGRPVTATDGPTARAGLTAVLAGTEGDVVVLPDDPATQRLAAEVVEQLRGEHRPGRPPRRVVVLPTTTPVQGLAALAVHDPAADLDAAVAAMSAAAGHVRCGAVRRAQEATTTAAGPTRPGDVLGLVDGGVVAVGASAEDVAVTVVARLLAGGGELVTAVLGADAPAGLDATLGEVLGRTRGVAEVQVLAGGQPGDLVLLGVE